MVTSIILCMVENRDKQLRSPLLMQLRPHAYAGTRIHLRPERVGMTRLDRCCYRLHLQVEGTASFETVDGVLTARPGMALLLDPDVRLQCRRPIHYVRISFDVFERERVLSSGVWSPANWQRQPPLAQVFGVGPLHYIPAELASLAKETAESLARFAPRNPASLLRANARLTLFIASCLEYHQGDREQTRALPFHLQVENHIQMEFARGLTIAGLAESMGLHPSQLFRRYKEATGVSPKTFLTRVRVEHAQRALRAKGANLTDIAEACGFPSLAAMRHAFRQVTGRSPTAWRQGAQDGEW